MSFSFSRCSTGGPETHSARWWLSLLHLISNSIGVPEGPFGRVWLSPPHLVLSSSYSNWNSNCLTSVLTELYNSSTPTQSPTRFLESHIGSSSSGNNCHAVRRSLSSRASVYDCTMGIFFFTSSHFISQFPPTRFPLITAIRMCHFHPVHHLHFWSGRRSKCHSYKYFHLTLIVLLKAIHSFVLSQMVPTIGRL